MLSHEVFQVLTHELIHARPLIKRNFFGRKK